MFNLSTRRLFLGILGIFLAVGPYRFLGLGGKIAIGSILALALLLELNGALEDYSHFGLRTSCTRNAVRIVTLVVLSGVFAEFINLSTSPKFVPISTLAESNPELRQYS